MSPAQGAIWQSVYDRVWVFLREVRTVDGGAKLARAEVDVAELEKLLAAEISSRDGYADTGGLSGAVLGKDLERIAPLIAENVALPSKGCFFDPREFLADADVRESYEDPDVLLEGGDASGEPASRTVLRVGSLSTAELIKLCVLLDNAGILHLVPAEEAEDISQVFAQRKKFDPARAAWILRLLFDRRRRNARERHEVGELVRRE